MSKNISLTEVEQGALYKITRDRMRRTELGRVSTSSYEFSDIGVVLSIVNSKDGGHDYNLVMRITRAAKECEIKPLLSELESIGYNVKVIKRR